MAVDTLAYSKALEAAGLDRRAAEAHVEAPTKHVFRALATKADLDALEARIERAIERSAHQLTVRLFGLMLGIVGLMNAILFALLRLVP
jgi:5-keto 4-deoxyuronate isomerase